MPADCSLETAVDCLRRHQLSVMPYVVDLPGYTDSFRGLDSGLSPLLTLATGMLPMYSHENNTAANMMQPLV